MFEDTYLRASERRLHKGSPWLRLGLVISLGLNTYLLLRVEHQSRDMARIERDLRSEIKGLSEASSAAFEVDQQRFYEMKKALETAAVQRPLTAEPDSVSVQPQAERGHSLETRTIEVKQHVVPSHLDTGATIAGAGLQAQDTSTSLAGVNAKPILPTAEMAATGALAGRRSRTPFESTVSEAKRTDGTALNRAIASKLAAPPADEDQNERDYFDIDLVRDKTGQTFGDVRIALKKSDLKHNRFTLKIFADDKVVEKKDQAVNEPMQVYVSVSSQPYEIVIKQVKRDEVIDSLAVPKAKTPPQAAPKTASLLAE